MQQFYLEESIGEHWSTRKLERNINSQYYQRMLSNQSKPKENSENPEVSHLAFINQNPDVFEFLNLPANLVHKEKDIEKGIFDHLQTFILELGKGFAFVARQKLFRTETSDFFVDLVFYHYHLNCFVVIDKSGRISHQNIGQRDMCVRMFDDIEKSPTDNPTHRNPPLR